MSERISVYGSRLQVIHKELQLRYKDWEVVGNDYRCNISYYWHNELHRVINSSWGLYSLLCTCNESTRILSESATNDFVVVLQKVHMLAKKNREEHHTRRTTTRVMLRSSFHCWRNTLVIEPPTKTLVFLWLGLEFSPYTIAISVRNDSVGWCTGIVRALANRRGGKRHVIWGGASHLTGRILGVRQGWRVATR